MAKYWIRKNGESEGPFSLSQLMEQELTSQTLVCKQGEANWAPLSKVDELKNLANIKQVPRNKSYTKIGVIIGVIALAIIIPIYYFITKNNKVKEGYALIERITEAHQNRDTVSVGNTIANFNNFIQENYTIDNVNTELITAYCRTIVKFFTDKTEKNNFDYSILESYISAVSEKEDAQISVFVMLGDSFSKQKEYEKALQMYKKGENIDDYAKYNIGYIHYRNSNIKKAEEYFYNSRYIPISRYMLGKIYYDENKYKRAAKFFSSAAEDGHAKSQNILGEMYEDGIGVPKNYTTAVEWYTEAALQGESTAQANLGNMYRMGMGGLIQNDKKAFDLYKKSADQGNLLGQYYLAFMYKNGYGVPQNYSKALEIYQVLTKEGVYNAYYSLGEMYEKGMGLRENIDKALECYAIASIQNEAAKFDFERLKKTPVTEEDIQNIQEFAKGYYSSDIYNQETKSYSISDEQKENDLGLIYLIIHSKSLDVYGKQKWFDLYTLMENEQIEKLYDVLLREKRELNSIDMKYETKINEINKKYQNKMNEVK